LIFKLTEQVEGLFDVGSVNQYGYTFDFALPYQLNNAFIHLRVVGIVICIDDKYVFAIKDCVGGHLNL